MSHTSIVGYLFLWKKCILPYKYIGKNNYIPSDTFAEQSTCMGSIGLPGLWAIQEHEDDHLSLYLSRRTFAEIS